MSSHLDDRIGEPQHEIISFLSYWKLIQHCAPFHCYSIESIEWSWEETTGQYSWTHRYWTGLHWRYVYCTWGKKHFFLSKIFKHLCHFVLFFPLLTGVWESIDTEGYSQQRTTPKNICKLERYYCLQRDVSQVCTSYLDRINVIGCITRCIYFFFDTKNV